MSLRPDLAAIAEMIEPNSRVLDVGCGDGALLEHLKQTRNVDGRGIELSQQNVNHCVARGLSVLQGDADTDLADYPSQAFDVVILSQTIQATRSPKTVLAALLRIGKLTAVSFPNFGHWRIRLSLLANGRMPQTRTLGYTWHETPNIHLCTIADFVADLRAATPSAAAELLVPDGADLARQLDRLHQRMATLTTRRLQAAAQRADHWQARLNAQRPQARLARDAQRLEGLRRRLYASIAQSNHLRRARLERLQARLAAQHPRLRLTPSRVRIADLRQRMVVAMSRRIERDRLRLAEQARTLHAVSPLATLERGYAIAFDERNAVVRRATDVAIGDRLRVMLASGEITVRRDG